MKGKNTAQFFLLRRESALWKYKTYARAAATTKWCSTKFQAVNVEIQIAFATVGVSGKRDVNCFVPVVGDDGLYYCIKLKHFAWPANRKEWSGTERNEMKQFLQFTCVCMNYAVLHPLYTYNVRTYSTSVNILFFRSPPGSVQHFPEHQQN